MARDVRVMAPGDYEVVYDVNKSRSSRVSLVRSADGDYFARKQIMKNFLTTKEQVRHVWDERNALQTLNQSRPELHIPKIHGTGQDDESVYLFLSFLPGAPLHHHIRSAEGFDEMRCRRYTKQLAEILLALHAEGFAYRDLKASNVVLSDGRPHLVDFGYCKKVDSPPVTNSPCGTYHAMSPEMHRNFVEDARYPYDAFCHDWWTLGILAFEMLNVTPPFGLHGCPEEFLAKASGSPENIPWPQVSASGRDFIASLLTPDVNIRLQGRAVLRHDWLSVDDVVPAYDVDLGSFIPVPVESDPFAHF